MPCHANADADALATTRRRAAARFPPPAQKLLPDLATWAGMEASGKGRQAVRPAPLRRVLPSVVWSGRPRPGRLGSHVMPLHGATSFHSPCRSPASADRHIYVHVMMRPIDSSTEASPYADEVCGIRSAGALVGH
ncbi:hypothetical protein ZWY2020_022555 [Hordeum vulgare]|nr:hypothetical protein ZWY2020_022555 [Hordeum vulgare]